MILNVRLYGDTCLRKKSKPVGEVTAAVRVFIDSLFDTMEKHQGVGLAAPQVGINEQIFVVDTGKEMFAVVNPKIVKKEGFDQIDEGCLSIPKLNVPVKRAKTIDVTFVDYNNNLVSATLTGLAAKVFQHEYDHLQGVMIIDYLPAAERREVEKAIVEGVYNGAKYSDTAKRSSKV